MENAVMNESEMHTSEPEFNKTCFLLSESHLSRSAIERAVIAAKANVDAAYKYSRME